MSAPAPSDTARHELRAHAEHEARSSFQASHRYPDIPPDEKKPGISRAKKEKRGLDQAYMPSQFGSASEIAGM